ncbi:MAG: Fe-S cluster assembly protein SufD [Flavobacteriales bacterium]|nr:Fe-S cluster assembly protein SufD [Flavobacteriales bacterium]
MDKRRSDRMIQVVAEKRLTQTFEAFETPMQGVQREAYEALSLLEIPTRRTEAWKYTPVKRITDQAWKRPVGQGKFDIHSLELPSIDAYVLLIVDGVVDSEQSSFPALDDVICKPLSQAMDSHPAVQEIHGKQGNHQNELFVAANMAFSEDGVYVSVGRNIKVDRPVHIVHVHTQAETAVFTRHIFDVAQGAEVRIVQSFFHLADPIHSNVVSEIRVADNAQCTIDKFQSGSTQSYHYSTEEVHQGRDATFTLNTITIDGAWTRNDPQVRLQGENSICHLNGAYMPTASELVDNHSIIDHLVPNCESHELYKGVVYDRSKGVFNGKVFVRPDAQKTNAYQQNANIVMSDRASMNSKPELEIYADDVKCSHGSTTGQLDKEALFYLQCRGLDRDKAKQLLINAFVGEVIEKLDSDIQDYAWARLSEKLEGR